MLQPGVRAPDFELSDGERGDQISLQDFAGMILVIVFLPSLPNPVMVSQLEQYQEAQSIIEVLNAHVVIVSDTPLQQLRQIAPDLKLGLMMLYDSNRLVWSKFAGTDSSQMIHPTIFVIDGDGKIRIVYETSRFPRLPGPRSLARAIRKLVDAPKPFPVTKQDWQLGEPSAPVTILEYSDYQCHRCAQTTKLIKEIIAEYGNKVRLVHRHFPLRQTHPLAQLAAEAAEAAGAQGKFWEMHYALFQGQDALDVECLHLCASEIGVDLSRFRQDLNSRRFEEAVCQDFKSAIACGVRLPPTLFINEILFDEAPTLHALQSRIASLL